MNLGISKMEVEAILKGNGVVDGEKITAEKFINAIYEVIDKNNKEIEKNIANFVSNEFRKKN